MMGTWWLSRQKYNMSSLIFQYRSPSIRTYFFACNLTILFKFLLQLSQLFMVLKWYTIFLYQGHFSILTMVWSSSSWLVCDTSRLASTMSFANPWPQNSLVIWRSMLNSWIWLIHLYPLPVVLVYLNTSLTILLGT